MLLAVVALAPGCQSLPPGRLGAVQPVSNEPRSGAVYLLRGWQDLYSRGIDQLAIQLRETGVRAEAYRASQWHDLAAMIARRYTRAPAREPLVLIGFSYGADDVLLIARELRRNNVPVDLLVTIDPVTPPPVPGNVRLCYNYFQTNGIWDVFPWLRGIPLASAGAGRLFNVDLRRQRPDLLEPGTGHSNIAANPKLHRAVIEQVLAVCPPRPPDPHGRAPK